MAKPAALPAPAQALPAQPIPTAAGAFVNGHALTPPFPAGFEDAVFGLGCFWGAERNFPAD